jgi:hypothetical protein
MRSWVRKAREPIFSGLTSFDGRPCPPLPALFPTLSSTVYCFQVHVDASLGGRGGPFIPTASVKKKNV